MELRFAIEFMDGGRNNFDLGVGCYSSAHKLGRLRPCLKGENVGPWKLNSKLASLLAVATANVQDDRRLGDIARQ
jgi:hypothetical protein